DSTSQAHPGKVLSRQVPPTSPARSRTTKSWMPSRLRRMAAPRPPNPLPMMAMEVAATAATILAGPEVGGRCPSLHLLLAAQDRAPFLVFGNRHPALDADADSRLRWFVLAQQTFQERHVRPPRVRSIVDTLDGGRGFPVDTRGAARPGRDLIA